MGSLRSRSSRTRSPNPDQTFNSREWEEAEEAEARAAKEGLAAQQERYKKASAEAEKALAIYIEATQKIERAISKARPNRGAVHRLAHELAIAYNKAIIAEENARKESPVRYGDVCLEGLDEYEVTEVLRHTVYNHQRVALALRNLFDLEEFGDAPLHQIINAIEDKGIQLRVSLILHGAIIFALLVVIYKNIHDEITPNNSMSPKPPSASTLDPGGSAPERSKEGDLNGAVEADKDL